MDCIHPEPSGATVAIFSWVAPATPVTTDIETITKAINEKPHWNRIHILRELVRLEILFG
jgi:hypothetical protein